MITVLHDRVLVALRPDPEEVTTASGLVLVRDPDRLKAPTQGIVVQVGEKSRTVNLDDARSALYNLCMVGLRMEDVAWPSIAEELDALEPAPFDVAVGDCVVFPLGAGEQIELNDVQYVILREDEILGIVDKKEAA